jgi:hypothetical protein
MIPFNSHCWRPSNINVKHILNENTVSNSGWRQGKEPEATVGIKTEGRRPLPVLRLRSLRLAEKPAAIFFEIFLKFLAFAGNCGISTEAQTSSQEESF